MKLVIQIPCFNEEKTLPLVLESLPKKIKNVDSIEVLVIDDGSADRTSEVASQYGVRHIIRHPRNKGLAVSFADGIKEALRMGADIIVNTDADNQYPQQEIPRLVQPIIKGKADVVIADRQTDKIKHFSKLKKFFQWFGSAIVRKCSNTKVPDAVSGFRAYSREAALELNVVTDFSYVIETIIQTQHKKLAVSSIKINTNPPTRKSRLFKNMFQHMKYSASTIIRIYTMYQPLKVFMAVGVAVMSAGIIPGMRFLYYVAIGEGAGHIQSLIFAAILIMVGFQIMMTGVVADLISINRKLIENSLRRIKQIELQSVIPAEETNWLKNGLRQPYTVRKVLSD